MDHNNCDNNHDSNCVTSNVIIGDIGAYSIKYGYDLASGPQLMGNCICKVKSERRRLYVGNQLDDCKDFSGLFYILPFNKGYLMNWEIQRQIFDYMFKKNLSISNYADKTLLFTEPYFNFRQLQENLFEILFEEYGFGKLAKCTPAYLSMIKYAQQDYENKCCLLVDSGHSFTHIVPFINGKLFKDAIRRIDVGGKALTNHLKDVISYRQLHVLDETYVINHCKEDCCYVSSQFDKDIEIASQKKNSIAREYVLPDFTSIKRGYIRQEMDDNSELQSIRMNNERFQVPEILFHPSDIGINQIGISHCIVHSIESCPEEFRASLYKSIVLIGGSANFPGLKERVYQDVRSLADSLYEVEVTLPEDPISYPWLGGKYLTNSLPELFSQMCHTKKEYEETGASNFIPKLELATFTIDPSKTEETAA